MITMIIVSIFFNFYEIMQKDVHQMGRLKDFKNFHGYFYSIYIKSWIWSPPYLFGLILGLLHMEYLEIKRENPYN